MVIVKITILLWALFFIIRFFSRATMDTKTALSYAFKVNKGFRIIDWILMLDFILCLVGTLASLVWILFLR